MNPKCTVAFVILIFIHPGASAQEVVKNYVQSKAVQIKSIEPSSTDYSDLKAIDRAIGNSTIVMLGEQDHGDAPTFLAKTKLIKYLHEKKGFDVLAFESDFFSLNEGWDGVKKDKKEIERFLRLNIYPIWTHCNACSTLFYNYIPNTYLSTHPLQIAGFDSDLVLDYSSKYLTTKLDSVIRHLDLPLVKTTAYATQVLPILDSLKYGFAWNLPDNFYLKSSTYLREIRRQIAVKLPQENFWVQVIDNLIYANINHQTRKRNDGDIIKSFNARDYQMARNLKWLCLVKYRGKKIVVWAANMHISRLEFTGGNKSGKGFKTMGYNFTTDTLLSGKSYVLGFTSYHGKAGRLTSSTYSIPTPKLNSFESWINKTWQYAFIDFRNYNKQYPNNKEMFYLKGLDHSSYKENWTKEFDGIFYIKEMYPCK